MVERVAPNALIGSVGGKLWAEAKKRIEGPSTTLRVSTNALHPQQIRFCRVTLWALAGVLCWAQPKLHMNTYPRRLYHVAPGWVRDGSLFHLRIRVDQSQAVSLTSGQLGADLLASARRYHEMEKWWCDLILLMPDHLHALLAFPAEPGMSETIRAWKRGAARLQGVQWQAGYFDHRIRSEKSAVEKWDYIRRNPVVKGLCANELDWPWWWSGAKQAGGLAAHTSTLE